MLKMTIDNEEVLSDNDISIKEEILSPSSTILNNVYPKSWELDKDYTSRFYYPKDYSKLNIQNFNIEPEEAGKTIQVNGSATLNDVDTSKESRVLRILGQTSQNGTPAPSSPIPINVVSGDNEINIEGKNLLKYPYLNTTSTVSGVTFTDNGDGSITIDGTSTSSTYSLWFLYENAWNYNNLSLELMPGTYTFKALGTNKVSMAVNFYTSDNTNQYFAVYNSDVTKTITEKVRLNVRLLVNGGATVDNVTIYPQIEVGSSASTYEPYQGNTYNIDLPVENLFDTTSLPITKNGVTVSKDSSGNVVLNGTPTISSGYIEFVVKNNFNLDANTYTVSIKEKKPGIGVSINDTNPPGTLNITMSDTLTTRTSTISALTNGVLSINVRYDVGTLTNFILNPQLEIGSKAHKYTPYGTTPIELCKIGNYQDYFYKDSGKWYLHKEIGKVVLNGSESWSYGTSGGYPRCTLNSLQQIKGYSDTNRHIGYFICSHFTPNTTDKTGHMYQYQRTILCNPTSDITSVELFKAWLSTNLPSLYFVLATPTNTEITDTTLLGQLESLSS